MIELALFFLAFTIACVGIGLVLIGLVIAGRIRTLQLAIEGAGSADGVHDAVMRDIDNRRMKPFVLNAVGL